MQQPLTMAARMLSQSMDSHLVRDRTIVVVTDGQVGGEDMILAGLAPHLHATRVMTIGIDQAVNAGFLRRLAAMGAGLFELVESEDRLDVVMDKIHRRIGLPVVQQLSLTSQGFIIDKIPDRGLIQILPYLFNRFFKLWNAFILSWIYGNYRNAQLSFKCSNINFYSFSLGHVHHGERNNYWYFQIDNLGAE